MAKSCPHFMKIINAQMQGSQKTPDRINTKKTIVKHITSKKTKTWNDMYAGPKENKMST